MIRSAKQKLVILGNGMAGARVAEEILKRDGLALFDITIIGAEPHGNYNRILLSNVLNGTQGGDEITINPLPWYKENGIKLLAGVPAIGINRHKRTVMLLDARQIPYDKLILATGSRPFVPPIPGTDRYGVFVFRTLEDCTAIARRAKTARTAVVARSSQPGTGRMGAPNRESRMPGIRPRTGRRARPPAPAPRRTRTARARGGRRRPRPPRPR